MKKFIAFTKIYLKLPSNYILASALFFAALMSLSIIYCLSILWPVKISLSVMLFIYSIYLYKKYINYTTAKSWVACQTLANLQWLLQNKKGEFCVGTLRSDTFVSSWLIILRWDIHWPSSFSKRIPVANIIIFKGMLNKTLWRHLCSYLRWH